MSLLRMTLIGPGLEDLGHSGHSANAHQYSIDGWLIAFSLNTHLVFLIEFCLISLRF
jgi:hypothetical protein